MYEGGEPLEKMSRKPKLERTSRSGACINASSSES